MIANAPVLTSRERRLCVLMMLASGHSSKEIATLLETTKATVDNDVVWWETRLGARSRAHAAAIALAAGLLSSEDVWFDGTREALDRFVTRRVRDAEELMDRLKVLLTRMEVRSGDYR